MAALGCGGDSGDVREPPLVATLGDSITAGSPRWSPNIVHRHLFLAGPPTPRSQWQYWAERATGGAFRFRNCGVEGERTDEIELRLEDCTHGAKVVVIQGGTNDIGQDRAPGAAAVNLLEMVKRAKAAGLRTLLATIPPLNSDYPRWAREVRRLNQLIRAVAREQDVRVIDFFGPLEDPARPGRMPPRLTDDGIHPTVSGYARIGRAAARALE